MELTEIQKEQIKLHAKTTYPNECCGILVGNSSESTVVICDNIADKPEYSFIINPDQIQNYDIKDIHAFYHSHKEEERFSIADIAFSEKLGKECVLYIVDKDIFKIYTPNGASTPYVGRPFFIGELDCINLFLDYYQRELNLQLPEIPKKLRINYTDTANKNFLYEYYTSNDFTRVLQPQTHDIILMSLPNVKFPVHILIYLGQNKVLHHLNEFSTIEPYNNAMKRLTTHIFRHRSLV